MNYALNDNEIRTLIKQCQFAIEAKYNGKLEDDNYFKRGFLLACHELTSEFVTALYGYEVVKKDG